MLPKFLIADNSQELPEKIFVVHCFTPQFILECELDDPYERPIYHWIDEEPIEEEVNALTEDAFEFLENELDSQEDLYEDEG